MSRTRTKDVGSTSFKVKGGQFAYDFAPGNWYDFSVVTQYSLPDSLSTSTSTITDNPGPRSGSNIHECQHTRFTADFTPIDIPPFRGVDGGGYAGTYRYLSPVCGLSGGWNTYASLFGDVSYQVNSFFNKQVVRGESIIPTTVSIPNFILEMDDIPKILDNLRSLKQYGFDTVEGLRSNYLKRPVRVAKRGQKRPKTASDFVENTIREGSNDYLGYQFGVLPLISDVKAALGSLDRVRRRIAYLKRNQGKSVPYERHATFDYPLNPARGWEPTTTNVQWKYVPISGTCEAALGWNAVHSLADLPQATREIASVLADTGFNAPLSVIWEAIPFSFLADYVSNVGQILSRYKVPSFTDSVRLLDGWSYVKSNFKAELHMQVFKPYQQSAVLFEGPIASLTYLDFKRSKGVPTNQGLQFDLSITDSQAKNVIALIAQALT